MKCLILHAIRRHHEHRGVRQMSITWDLMLFPFKMKKSFSNWISSPRFRGSLSPSCITKQRFFFSIYFDLSQVNCLSSFFVDMRARKPAALLTSLRLFPSLSTSKHLFRASCSASSPIFFVFRGSPYMTIFPHQDTETEREGEWKEREGTSRVSSMKGRIEMIKETTTVSWEVLEGRMQGKTHTSLVSILTSKIHSSPSVDVYTERIDNGSRRRHPGKDVLLLSFDDQEEEKRCSQRILHHQNLSSSPQDNSHFFIKRNAHPCLYFPPLLLSFFSSKSGRRFCSAFASSACLVCFTCREEGVI